MFLGLRTALYRMSDLDAGKAWFAQLLGAEPYFDEPFYVGFNVGGYELGLVPIGDDGAEGEPVAYWGVPDVDVALAALLDAGATLTEAVTEVGEGIRVAAAREPNGNVVGVIENPHFVVSPPATTSEGKGR